MKINTSSLTQKTRLDKHLKDTMFSDLSRTQIQKRIENGQILVNGKEVTKHCFITHKDLVEVLKEPKESFTSKATKKIRAIIKVEHDPKIEEEKKELLKKIKIIDETDDFVIIEKPSGISVHPANTDHHNITLVDWINKNYKLKKVGEHVERPGIVHRIDKEVSGLLIIAKNQEFYRHIKTQFQTRKVIKKYFALVIGVPSKAHGEINFSIERSRLGTMSAKPMNASLSAKKSITLYDVHTQYDGYTLLDLQPLTGRTHQIRTHLKALGHPIVGDKLYSINEHKWSQSLREKTRLLGRVFLHAYHLEFTDDRGATHTYTINLPIELQNFLKLFAPIKR